MVRGGARERKLRNGELSGETKQKRRRKKKQRTCWACDSQSHTRRTRQDYEEDNTAEQSSAIINTPFLPTKEKTDEFVNK